MPSNKKNTPEKFIKLILGALIASIIFLFLDLSDSFFSTNVLPPKVYRIAYDEAWYPLNLSDKEQDISIFSEEILRSIAAEQHFFVELISINSNDLFEGIEREEYDGILSSLILHDEDAKKYISSDPYYLLGPVLIVPKSSHIKSLQDLKGKSIGIITGFEYVSALDNYPSVNFVLYDYNDRSKLIDDVSNQIIDGAVMRMISASEYTSGLYRDQLKIALLPFNSDGLRLITKNTHEYQLLIRKFNEGLKAMKKSGTYDKLLIKWDLFNPEKS